MNQTPPVLKPSNHSQRSVVEPAAPMGPAHPAKRRVADVSTKAQPLSAPTGATKNSVELIEDLLDLDPTRLASALSGADRSVAFRVYTLKYADMNMLHAAYDRSFYHEDLRAKIHEVKTAKLNAAIASARIDIVRVQEETHTAVARLEVALSLKHAKIQLLVAQAEELKAIFEVGTTPT